MKPEGGILLKQALSVCRWPWRTPCPSPAPSVPGDCGASQVGLGPQTSVWVGGWARLSRSLKMPRISLVVLLCFCVGILLKKTQARPSEEFTCCSQRKAGMCNPGRHQSPSQGVSEKEAHFLLSLLQVCLEAGVWPE